MVALRCTVLFFLFLSKSAKGLQCSPIYNGDWCHGIFLHTGYHYQYPSDNRAPLNYPLPSSRQHLSSVACLEDKRELLCALLYTTVVHNNTHTRELFSHFYMLGLNFYLCVYLGFVFYVFFYVSLGHFVLYRLLLLCWI